jgi:hypothetical protein
MKYELVKRLMNAGYTRENPTLEELILDCGYEFLGLSKSEDIPGNITWYADTRTKNCDCGKPNCNGLGWKLGEGTTPIEAVAELWIKMNTK